MIMTERHIDSYSTKFLTQEELIMFMTLYRKFSAKCEDITRRLGNIQNAAEGDPDNKRRIVTLPVLSFSVDSADNEVDLTVIRVGDNGEVVNKKYKFDLFLVLKTDEELDAWEAEEISKLKQNK